MFDFLRNLFRPSIRIEPLNVRDTDGAEPSRPVRTRPACLRFDESEMTDFGRQVATLMTLQPDQWRIHESYRALNHPELGGFEFDQNDRIQHLGVEPFYAAGNGPTPGKLRALTQGDHFAIVEALRSLLKRPMDIGTHVDATQPGPAIYRGTKPMTGNVGDLYIDESYNFHRFNGSEWVAQSDVVKATSGPFHIRQQAYAQGVAQQQQANHTADAMGYALAADPNLLSQPSFLQRYREALRNTPPPTAKFPQIDVDKTP